MKPPGQMILSFEDTQPDTPLVERIWRSRSEGAGVFSSVAASHWEMVVTRVDGETAMIVRGPETQATNAVCPPQGEWIGIRFRLGTFMPQLPIAKLMDRQDVKLPHLSTRTFWLDGAAWEYPTYENAETFVQRLARAGLIGRDALVDAVVEGKQREVTTRSAERRFLRATGLTHGAFRQIERARHAAMLLIRGAAIADAAYQAGYFDQAHLTRSFKKLIGQTPGQVARGEKQLSFLYKTESS